MAPAPETGPPRPRAGWQEAPQRWKHPGTGDPPRAAQRLAPVLQAEVGPQRTHIKREEKDLRPLKAQRSTAAERQEVLTYGERTKNFQLDDNNFSTYQFYLSVLLAG